MVRRLRRRTALRVRVESVLPAFLPCEVGVAEVRERHATEEVIERPAYGDVVDEKDAIVVPAEGQIVQEPFDPLDRPGSSCRPLGTAGRRAAALGVMLLDWCCGSVP